MPLFAPEDRKDARILLVVLAGFLVGIGFLGFIVISGV